MYARILVPVDGSEPSMSALKEAAKIARSQGSRVRLLHVVNELVLDYTMGAGVYADGVIDALREAGRKILEQAKLLVEEQGLSPEHVLIESVGGRCADLILDQAKSWPADLIVMGTHGRRGLVRMALGSDAEEVVRGAPVPVLLIRARQQPEAAAQAAATAAKASVA